MNTNFISGYTMIFKRIWIAVLIVFLLTPCISNADSSSNKNKWELKMHNGVPTPFHNGQPKLLNILYENDSWFKEFMGSIAGIARKAHINMHMMHVTVDLNGGYSVKELKELNSAGKLKNIYKATFERLEKLMQADPNGYVMIRIGARPPIDWLQKYPDDMVKDDKGKYAKTPLGSAPVSFFSDRFFNCFEKGVRKMVTFLENSKYGDRILGYQPMTGNTGEWNRPQSSPSRIADYSEAAQKAFKRHLLKKYKNVAGINAALGTAFESEADICVPAEKDFVGDDGNYFKSPQEAKYTREYLELSSTNVANRIVSLCKIIKEVNPGRLVGTSYNYWFGAGQGGIRGLLMGCHFSWPILGNSKYLDYVLSPPYYALCGPSKPTTNHCLINSFALYGKTYLAESDHPTHLICRLPEIMATPIIWTFKMGDNKDIDLAELYKKIAKKTKSLPIPDRYGIDYGKNYQKYFIEAENKNFPLKLKPSVRVPSNMQESVANILRLGVNVVTKPISGIWWWDMEGCGRKCTDGISYNHPKLIATLKKVGDIFKTAVKLDRSSSSEVAVFYSNEAFYYAKAGMKGWEYLRSSLPLNLEPLESCGIPYDRYYFDDLEKIPNIDQYKLCIFVNSHYVTQKRRDWINKNLKKNNRVLVWFYGSGYLNEDSKDVKNIIELTGINFKEMNRRELLASITSKSEGITSKIKTGTPFGAFVTTGKRKSPLAKPHFVVKDPNAEVLGVSYRRKEPNFAIKEFKNWTSVYLPGGVVPAQLLKNLAKTASINVYTDDSNIQVWANKTMLGLYSYPSVKGLRKISLPESIIKCQDFLTGKIYIPENHQLKLKFNGSKTMLFILTHNK
jgi:hypothetical protein